jgi:hypothetical protein
MKTDPNYTPKLTIKSSADTKSFALIFYGVPIILLCLALPFPFFRHIFTFGSFVVTILAILGCISAYEDKMHGVKRDKPINRGFTLPSWFKHVFFAFMIALSAGLRLGWYTVPVLWVINWACLVSLQSHIKATYREEKQS